MRMYTQIHAHVTCACICVCVAWGGAQVGEAEVSELDHEALAGQLAREHQILQLELAVVHLCMYMFMYMCMYMRIYMCVLARTPRTGQNWRHMHMYVNVYAYRYTCVCAPPDRGRTGGPASSLRRSLASGEAQGDVRGCKGM